MTLIPNGDFGESRLCALQVFWPVGEFAEIEKNGHFGFLFSVDAVFSVLSFWCFLTRLYIDSSLNLVLLLTKVKSLQSSVFLNLAFQNRFFMLLTDGEGLQ